MSFAVAIRKLSPLSFRTDAQDIARFVDEFSRIYNLIREMLIDLDQRTPVLPEDWATKEWTLEQIEEWYENLQNWVYTLDYQTATQVTELINEAIGDYAAITDLDSSSDASTAYLDYKKTDLKTREVTEHREPLPVVDATKSGVVNPASWDHWEGYENRILALEGQELLVYDFGTDPDSSTITTVWVQEMGDNPSVKDQVINTGDSNRSYIYASDSVWHPIGQNNIGYATSTTDGIVKNNPVDGGVVYDGGKGSVQDWDKVVKNVPGSYRAMLTSDGSGGLKAWNSTFYDTSDGFSMQHGDTIMQVLYGVKVFLATTGAVQFLNACSFAMDSSSRLSMTDAGSIKMSGSADFNMTDSARVALRWSDRLGGSLDDSRARLHYFLSGRRASYDLYYPASQVSRNQTLVKIGKKPSTSFHVSGKLTLLLRPGDATYGSIESFEFDLFYSNNVRRFRVKNSMHCGQSSWTQFPACLTPSWLVGESDSDIQIGFVSASQYTFNAELTAVNDADSDIYAFPIQFPPNYGEEILASQVKASFNNDGIWSWSV
jgi:hypothetical protein